MTTIRTDTEQLSEQEVQERRQALGLDADENGTPDSGGGQS